MMKAMLASSSKTWLEEVQADSPIALWLMQEASGTTLTATVGNNGSYSASGITYQAAGEVVVDRHPAARRGTADNGRPGDPRRRLRLPHDLVDVAFPCDCHEPSSSRTTGVLRSR